MTPQNLTQAPDVDPNSLSIDQVLAMTFAFRSERNFRAARKLLHAALNTISAERRANFYSDLGTTEACDGHYAEAIEAHRQTLALAPDFTPSAYQLACLLAAKGHFEEANELFMLNLPVPTDNGERTTTAIVRFPYPSLSFVIA